MNRRGRRRPFLNEILHLVQEKKEVIEITSGDELIAHVIPAGLTYKPDWLVPSEGDVLTDMERVTKEIDARWHGSTTTSYTPDEYPF